jgi:hypothetical protein
MGGFYDKGKWENMDELSVKDAMVNSMYDAKGREKLGANVGWSDLGCKTRMDRVPMSDFFVMKNGIVDRNIRDGEEDMDVFLIEDAVDFGRGRQVSHV